MSMSGIRQRRGKYMALLGAIRGSILIPVLKPRPVISGVVGLLLAVNFLFQQGDDPPGVRFGH